MIPILQIFPESITFSWEVPQSSVEFDTCYSLLMSVGIISKIRHPLGLILLGEMREKGIIPYFIRPK